MREARRTIVYIDGFNFYYRCLKGSRYKWLNPVALCRDVLSSSNDRTALARNQFADQLMDGNGTFRKPSRW